MINKLKDRIPNLIVEENCDMKEYSTFKLGGKAKVLVKVKTPIELREVLSFVKEEQIPYVFVGNGSNTVFKDGMYNGIAIKFASDGEFNDVRLNGETVTCGANVLISNLAKFCQENSLSGMEKISGIPGTVGGGSFMNAGAYEGSISDILISCHAVSFKDERDFSLGEMNMSYRHSVFMENGYIITSVTLKLNKGNKDDILNSMKEYQIKRNEKQPLKYPSCGSVFKRPEGTFAGKLIEESGLKGKRIGGVEVSTLHAGFIINIGGGTATDLINLIDYIKKKVYEDHKVMLEEEIILI